MPDQGQSVGHAPLRWMQMRVVHATGADVSHELADIAAGMVEMACAEVGVPMNRTYDNGLIKDWETVTEDQRHLFEKAKALVFDRLNIPYEWIVRSVRVKDQAHV